MEPNPPQDLNLYNLVATVGSSPAVVTEIIWYYAMDRDLPRYPARVTILTTNHGKERWENTVLSPGNGGTSSPWDRLREDVLLGLPVSVQILRPRHDGGEDQNGPERDYLDDITTALEDEQSANLIYKTVCAMTRPGQLPVVGSIAGGRKTMSAHLMTAFAAHARRSDDLVHVLVPTEDEFNRAYFFPNKDVLRIDSGIQCIQIPVPLLNPYFKRGLFKKMDKPPENLGDMMRAFRPFEFADPEDVAPKATLYIGDNAVNGLETDGDALYVLDFPGPDGEDQGNCQLSPQNIATLLVLAQAFTEAGGPVSVDLLIGAANLERYAYAVTANRSMGRSSYQPWENTNQFSKALSRLNDQLARIPVADGYLTIKGTGRGAKRLYYWHHNKPVAFSVQADPGYFYPSAWQQHFPNLPLEIVQG